MGVSTRTGCQQYLMQNVEYRQRWVLADVAKVSVTFYPNWRPVKVQLSKMPNISARGVARLGLVVQWWGGPRETLIVSSTPGLGA
jgi:hypothetical protein